MTEFRLTIRLGNDAMQTPEDVACALREVSWLLDAGATSSNVRDDNGNVVGGWELGDDEDDDDEEED
jgi:hypothetical protein